MAVTNSGFTLGVSMVLRDMFSGPSQRVRNNMALLSSQTYNTQQQMMRSSRDLSLGIAAVGLMATRGIMSMVKVGSEYGYTMEFVKAITKSTGAEFDLLEAKGKALAGTSIFKPTEIASGMQFMAMAGMTSKEVLDNIEAATYLSQATTHQLGGKGGGADILTNIMKGFQIESENSMQVADVLTTAVTSANTNLFDLGEAMKYAMSTAHQLNIGFEETAAGIMVLGNAGIQASMAGVAMENMLRYYARAGSEWTTGKVSKVMESIGATKEDVVDAKGNMRTISDFMGRLKTKMTGLGSLETNNVMREIFGVRGNRAAIQIFQNLDKLGEFTDKLKNDAPGTAMGISSKLMDTMAGRLNALASAWEAFYASFSKALEPVLKPVLLALTYMVKAVQAIADTPVLGTFLVGGLTSVVALTTAMWGFNALLTTAVMMSARLGRNLGLSNLAMSGLGSMGVTGAGLGRAARGARGAAPVTAAGAMSGVGVNSAGRAYWLSGNALGRRPGTLLPNNLASSLAPRGATGAGMSGIFGRIATSLPWLARGIGFLGRAFSFMLGPWGLLISFLLPSALQLLGSLVSSTDKNTEAKKAEAKSGDNNVRGGYQKAAGVLIYDNEAGTIEGRGNTNQSAHQAGYSKDGDKTIIFNIDGREVFRKTLKELEEQSDYDSGIITLTN